MTSTRTHEIKSIILAAAKSPQLDSDGLKELLDQLISESGQHAVQKSNLQTAVLKQSDPACMGLAAFAMNATMNQMYNLNVISAGPTMMFTTVFGGFILLFAGLLNFSTGNGFGHAAFSTYGAYWITMALIMYLREFTTVQVTHTDMGVFMLVMLMFTCIMLSAACGRSLVLCSIFFTLAWGYVFMALYNFFPSVPWFKTVGAIFLLTMAGLAYYLLLVNIFLDTYKRRMWVGPPLTDWFKKPADLEEEEDVKRYGAALVAVERNRSTSI